MTYPGGKSRRVSQIISILTALIRDYEHQSESEWNQILGFHVQFEEIFPFEDGNGRIGRLIMFKECLRHGVMPFILDDKHRSQYLAGIKDWPTDRSTFIELVYAAQSRFEAQVELQKLGEYRLFVLPEDDEEEDV